MTTRMGLIASSVTWLALVEPLLAVAPALVKPVLALAPAPVKPVLVLCEDGSGPPREVMTSQSCGLPGFVTLSPKP